MDKFLVIQTAFTGDVVLATALVEKLHSRFPEAQIDFLLRKGNEGLLAGHPMIRKVLIWDKKQKKISNLLRIAMEVRNEKYSQLINVHRFASSGFVAFLSRADKISGFDKNPFSFCYTRRVPHVISAPYSETIVHETMRNQGLIADITDDVPALPKLYPSQEEYKFVKQFQAAPYVCIAPSSVWFTKQFPSDKWVSLINSLPSRFAIYVLGAPGDKLLAQRIMDKCNARQIENMCGKLSFLQSAALMEGAEMNYANDSAPLHFASAMGAPVTAVFCSTVPAFGFGPLRENGRVVEVAERLSCRPCGLHGHKECPQGHFKCALEITNDQLLWWTSKTI